MSQTTTLVADKFLAGFYSEEQLQREGVERVLNEHGIRARIFGEMIKLAGNTVEHYHGDFYHDAMWLNEHMNEMEFSFYWGFDNCGTAMGTDLDLVKQQRKVVFLFTLYLVNHSFHLKIEKVSE